MTVMGSFGFILSLFGWTFVPDLASKHLLNFLYKQPLFRLSVPHPGSLHQRKHYSAAFSVVILAYLSYSMLQSARAMPPNFYQILGVPPEVDENGLKLAFRAFAKKNHPDRPGVGREGEAMFMHVRDAFEALKDPVVRFAYDRFGPDVVGWRQNVKTTREFLYHGLLVSSGYHIVTGIVLLFWTAIGQPSTVSFWRYVLFAALLSMELSFILSPFPDIPSNIHPPRPSLSTFITSMLPLFRSTSSFSVLQTLFPGRVPYQHILFLHQLFLFLSVALSRVVPHLIFLLQNDFNSDSPRQLDPIERAIWERIYGTLAIADREASIVLHTILQSISLSSKPYHDPTLARMHPLSLEQTVQLLDRLTPEMRALVIEANIKNHTAGPIAAAAHAALINAHEELSARKNGESSKQDNLPSVHKNFWEKDDPLSGEIVTVVDNVDLTGSPHGSPASVSKLPRLPSTPRLSGNNRRLSASPERTLLQLE